jgi:hypothetical protein
MYISISLGALLVMNDHSTSDGQRHKAETDANLPAWLELVRQQVSSLKFGTVQITVHDSRVTQVERLEKVRLDRAK